MSSQNNNSTYLVLGCPVQAFADENEVVSHLRNLATSKTGGYSVAINAEKIEWYNNSDQIKDIIDNALLRVPDGSGALLGLKILHKINSIKVDLPVLTLRCADENGFKVFLLGASLKHNHKAQENIKTKYPGIQAVDGVDGFYESLDTVIAQIDEFNPDVIMVGLGTPKQELVSSELHKKLPEKIFINCGGAL
ncbi:MAG: WecB/TagA/CpsF family glycosyltransferase, partial [Roseivirga sp.]|nr:WecB/TagA/CpsF family glycosyltransferase [Roseivirga sp.]